jgi:hypothetical protein
MAADGTCQPCHASCGTCEYANDINSCTSCKEDSTLAVSAGNKFCVCDFPKVRLESSYTCENECPSGTVLDNEYKLCIRDSTRGSDSQAEVDFYFKFETKLPIFNMAANGRETTADIYADSCSPPYALGKHRGSYFWGYGARVEIENFFPAHKYSEEFWMKLDKPGLISTHQAHLFAGWSSYKDPNPPCNCDSTYDYEAENVWRGAIILVVTECYTPEINIVKSANLDVFHTTSNVVKMH